MSDKRSLQTVYRSSMERRRFIRVVEGRPLTFVSTKGSNGEGELLNISLRGMRFISETQLQTGEKIRTLFLLGNGIALDLNGMIRHRKGKPRKWIYGTEFSISDYHDLKEHMKLNQYIISARARQDRLLQTELLGRKHI